MWNNKTNKIKKEAKKFVYYVKNEKIQISSIFCVARTVLQN